MHGLVEVRVGDQLIKVVILILLEIKGDFSDAWPLSNALLNASETIR